jgi:hypothetical protein
MDKLKFYRQNNIETFAAESGEMHIRGYGALYYDGTEATEYNIGGYFITRFMPGSFALDGGEDIRAFFNHDANIVLGRTSSGTLSLSLDNKGLYYDIVLPDTQSARDIYASVQRGDISGASVTIIPKTGGDNTYKQGEVYIRELHAVELLEVGPVTVPAFDNTSAIAASANDMGADKVIEDYQRREFEARERNIQQKDKVLAI